MLGSHDIIAFIGTRDPSRARSFYYETLGLTLLSEDPFALTFDANGTLLRITTVPEVTPAKYTVLGWNVPDIRAATAQLAKSGVHLERFDQLTQDEFGVWTAPGGTRVAWFKDPDGNLLSLSEFGVIP
jgi:catechol 2,3-dioxygenase-like lactoylglutathione lyase family enzyme